MAATARACPRAAARRSFGVLRRYRRGVTPTAAGGAASAPPRPELVESADVERVLYSEAAIAERVEALGAQLSQDYAERKPVLVRDRLAQAPRGQAGVWEGGRPVRFARVRQHTRRALVNRRFVCPVHPPAWRFSAPLPKPAPTSC